MPTGIDIERWPALAGYPTGPTARVSAGIARQLFRAASRRLNLEVVHGSGVPVEPVGTDASTGLAIPTLRSDDAVDLEQGADRPSITIHRPREFYTRLGTGGLIGLGESYLSRAWDSADLGGALTVLAREMPRLVPQWMQRLRRFYVSRVPDRLRSTETQSRGNIAHHYDLSNEMFALFLDPTLTYSSAMFDADERPGDDQRHRRLDPPAEVTAADLEIAQVRKVDRLLDRIGVGPDRDLLEIGTGWGELAIRAAKRGARVHSITLSSEQREHALQRAADEGVGDRVTVALQDYRHVDQPAEGHGYDAVASVEMIEAVGHEFWADYFGMIDRVLAPGGAAGIQAITMPHDRMLATRDTWTFIGKYIFPGGFLPSTEVIDSITRGGTRLRIEERLSFGSHYAATLALWDRAFRVRTNDWLALGFDGTFGRMWHYYLEYSRAGFASGYLDVQQIVLRKAA